MKSTSKARYQEARTLLTTARAAQRKARGYSSLPTFYDRRANGSVGMKVLGVTAELDRKLRRLADRVEFGYGHAGGTRYTFFNVH